MFYREDLPINMGFIPQWGECGFPHLHLFLSEMREGKGTWKEKQCCE